MVYGGFMNDLFEKLTKKKKELDSAFKNLPLLEKQLQNIEEWLKVELTYSSNAIEGNTLSRIETAEVIERGVGAIISGKPLKDILEAINHARALDFIKNLAKTRKSHQFITEKDILSIHKIILTSINDYAAGSYRNSDVFIRGVDVEFPRPQKVPYLMKDFVSWLEGQQDKHPAKVAADAHFRLVSIHPFIDGNGRTARLLMNLILIINGYPMAIVRSEERTEYLEAVNRGQTKHDLMPFYKTMIIGIERSLDAYIAAAKGRSIIPFFIEKAEVSARNLLHIGKIASLANVAIPTVRYYIDEELIKPEGKSKGGVMLFSPKAAERIREIKRLQQKERLSIKEIRSRLK